MSGENAVMGREDTGGTPAPHAQPPNDRTILNYTLVTAAGPVPLSITEAGIARMVGLVRDGLPIQVGQAIFFPPGILALVPGHPSPIAVPKGVPLKVAR